MKINLNRREEQKGLFSKKIWYYLEFTLEMTAEENALIEKHKWGDDIVVTYKRDDGVEMTDKLFMLLRGECRRSFTDVVDRIEYEGKLVESLKQLKTNLQAVASESGSSSTEIEL